MAINVPQGSYDPLRSNRPPVVGDTQVHYDPLHNEHKFTVYDGTNWNVMARHNLTATQTMNIAAASGGNYNTVSTVANAWKNDLCTMFAEHVRVAEYVNDKGKIEKVQLEWREGNGSHWEPITRVQIKL